MSDVDQPDDGESDAWVRLHVVTYFVILIVAGGLIIVDSKVAQIVGPGSMPAFRTILLISVILAGLGARALLAWRSATVDLQGRIFLAAAGLVLLTGAAFGLSDCMQEIRDGLRVSEVRELLSNSRRAGSDGRLPGDG